MREKKENKGKNIGRGGGERENIGGRAVGKGEAKLLQCDLTLFC